MSRLAPAALLLALVLAGCTSLDPVGSSPEPAAALPTKGAVLEVRWDRPLDPRRAASAPVTLVQGDERIPVTVELAGSGDALVVRPLADLRPGIPAELRVDAGVAGLGRRQSREAVTLRWPVAAKAAAPMRSKSFQLQGSVAPR